MESLVKWFSFVHPFIDLKNLISDACTLYRLVVLMIQVSEPYKSVGVAITFVEFKFGFFSGFVFLESMLKNP